MKNNTSWEEIILIFKTFYDQNGFVWLLGMAIYISVEFMCASFYYLLSCFIRNSADISDRSIPVQREMYLPFGLKKFASSHKAVISYLFFRIVTDTRYNSIADDCICFSIDGGRIRGFRVDELWPFSSGQTGSAERTHSAEFHSVKLSLIKNSSVRRTASGNVQRTVRTKHACVNSLLPSFRTPSELFSEIRDKQQWLVHVHRNAAPRHMEYNKKDVAWNLTYVNGTRKKKEKEGKIPIWSNKPFYQHIV